MKHLVIIGVAVVFTIALTLLKKHREKIFICGIVLMCLINGAYSFVNAESVLPSRQTFSQTFYTTDFLDTQEFPDAFLRHYFKGKTVYVKDDAFHTHEETKEAGYWWEFGTNHYYSMVHYLESVYANVIPKKELNDSTVSTEKRSDFESIGYTNDMFRNMCMYSGINDETGNYLYYLHWYRDATKPAKMYMNVDSLKEDDEIVIIWQFQGDDGLTEDMYVMGRQYYENEIK